MPYLEYTFFLKNIPIAKQCALYSLNYFSFHQDVRTSVLWLFDRSWRWKVARSKSENFPRRDTIARMIFIESSGILNKWINKVVANILITLLIEWQFHQVFKFGKGRDMKLFDFVKVDPTRMRKSHLFSNVTETVLANSDPNVENHTSSSCK